MRDAKGNTWVDARTVLRDTTQTLRVYKHVDSNLLETLQNEERVILDEDMPRSLCALNGEP